MAILQAAAPVWPWADPQLARLPGLKPVAPADWLHRDEAFAAQMAERDRLLVRAPGAVLAPAAGMEGAARELLSVLRAELPATHGHRRQDDARLIRPDGVAVDLSGDPLLAAARLVQEDLLLLERTGEGHVLRGGVLCFPAFWTLSQKIGKPLLAVHAPVEAYGAPLNARIERILDHLTPDTALMRANVLLYSDPALHQPAPEGARRIVAQGGPLYIRIERQTLRRLPRTGAVVFAIHTFVVPVDRIPDEARASLRLARPGWGV